MSGSNPNLPVLYVSFLNTCMTITSIFRIPIYTNIFLICHCYTYLCEPQRCHLVTKNITQFCAANFILCCLYACYLITKGDYFVVQRVYSENKDTPLHFLHNRVSYFLWNMHFFQALHGVFLRISRRVILKTNSKYNCVRVKTTCIRLHGKKS